MSSFNFIDEKIAAFDEMFDLDVATRYDFDQYGDDMNVYPFLTEIAVFNSHPHPDIVEKIEETIKKKDHKFVHITHDQQANVFEIGSDVMKADIALVERTKLHIPLFVEYHLRLFGIPSIVLGRVGFENVENAISSSKGLDMMVFMKNQMRSLNMDVLSCRRIRELDYSLRGLSHSHKEDDKLFENQWKMPPLNKNNEEVEHANICQEEQD
jgi:hypothetical protein